MVHLFTLGGLDLRGPDGTALRSGLAQPKRLALLVYLVLGSPSGFHRRDTLFALFWPESDYERARSALNQSVYYLRRSLGADVVVNRGDEVGVDPARLWCDAAAFERALDAGELREAVELYRGPLLPGFHVDGSAEWELWLEAERVRLETRAAEAARALADKAERSGDLEEALRWGRRASSLAPDDEVQLRRLIGLLGRAGDRAGAVQAYEETAARLRRELGIEPSAETRDLVRRLLAEEGSGAASGVGSERPPAIHVAAKREPEPRSLDPPPPRRTSRARVRAAALVAVAILAGALLVRSGRDGPREGASPRPPPSGRLAVLPFADLSADPADRYLADGMTEEIISRLSRLADARVIARSSVMAFRDTESSATEIGRALDARFLIEGSVRREGERIRITVQLIDSESQEHLWAESYDADLVDVLRVQGEIAERVARALSLRLRPGEAARLAGVATTVPEARREYLRGRFLLAGSDEASFRAAIERFRRALEADPAYAPAWSGLSDAYDHLAGVGASPSAELYPRAREAAERALALDPELAEAHASLAMALSYHFWDSGRAEHHFRRAIELQPSNARARRTYAGHLRNLGRFDEALVQAEAARDLDPIPFWSHFELLVIPYFQRRYDETVARAESLVATDPRYGYAHFLEALALTQQERWEPAIAALEQVDPAGDVPEARALRGYVLARTGRRDAALEILAGIERRPDAAARGFNRAILHIGLGDPDRALAALEDAYRARDFRLRILAFEPLFDPLRTDPRFQDLLRRVGLPSGHFPA